MKIIKKVYKFISKFFYGALIICAISYLSSSYKVHKREEVIPNILGYYGFTILTGSMEPAISIGDFIISRKVHSESINVGDIITFIDEDIIVTHRVSQILKNQSQDAVFITKGDANNVEDDNVVNTKDVVSKYICSIPFLGYLLNYFKYGNKLTLVGVGILIYLGFTIVEQNINRKINNRKVDNDEFEQ